MEYNSAQMIYDAVMEERSEDNCTLTIDYRALLLKFAQAVVDDDCVVGLRCLTAQGAEYTPDELAHLELIRREVWPKEFLGSYLSDES